MQNEELKAKVEAVLFVTARAMHVPEIAELLEVEEDLVEQAFEFVLDKLLPHFHIGGIRIDHCIIIALG